MSNEENAPAVSVLVPIYNVERYLRECLDSLRAQTFEDFEVLCINDGSTDSSEGIVREFVKSDRRFRLISKENSGYGASMNRGLDEAKGECIAILESDDFMEPRALEVLHKAVSEGDADFAKANFSLYWTHPSPRNEFFEIVTPELDGCVVNPRDVPALFHAKSSIWSGMYRASFLKGNAIRFGNARCLVSGYGIQFQGVGRSAACCLRR